MAAIAPRREPVSYIKTHTQTHTHTHKPPVPRRGVLPYSLPTRASRNEHTLVFFLFLLLLLLPPFSLSREKAEESAPSPTKL